MFLQDFGEFQVPKAFLHLGQCPAKRCWPFSGLCDHMFFTQDRTLVGGRVSCPGCPACPKLSVFFKVQ